MTPAAISPDKILKDLDLLWVSMSKDQNPDNPDAVLRACAMTLLVATEGDGEEIGETLAQLVRDHPSRLIVLRVFTAVEPKLEARVLAQCWMPLGRRQQICCEQVEIALSPSTMADIPPVLRGLIVPDLPVVIWSRGRDVLALPEFQPILNLAGKLILDSQGVADLAGRVRLVESLQSPARLVADLAWTRLTRWREAVAQVFDDPATLARLGEIRKIEVQYEGDFLPMSALYLAAWFKYALQRGLVIAFTYAGPSDRARVSRVGLVGEGLDFYVTVGQDGAVEIHSGVRDARAVFPLLSEYELMREELNFLGRDNVYESVLRLVPEFTNR